MAHPREGLISAVLHRLSLPWLTQKISVANRLISLYFIPQEKLVLILSSRRYRGLGSPLGKPELRISIQGADVYQHLPRLHYHAPK